MVSSFLLILNRSFPQNFTGQGESDSVRCDTPEQLLLKGCTSEYLVDPKSLAEPQEDKERDQKQLSPKNVTVFLRPGRLELGVDQAHSIHRSLTSIPQASLWTSDQHPPGITVDR